jgi:iron only hydrogenase large subunit-like protein
MISCDGCTDIVSLFKKHPKKVFYDILFCEGGCMGGPGVAAKTPMFFRKYSMAGYLKVAKKESMRGRQGLDKYLKGLDFSKSFD